MENNNLKQKAAIGFFWAYGERVIAQIVALIVSIILSRLLMPDHYGVISIVTIFITFADIFVSGGLGSSLVQKKNADELDYNTAFWIGLNISILLYLVLFVLSPYVATFYEMPILCPVIRVMAIRLPIAALNTIQHAIIQKKMEFKKFFWATLFGTLISAVVGIGLALIGKGVWALVGQYLINSIIDTIVLLVIEPWKPQRKISLKRMKQILAFGWKVFAQQMFFTITNNIQSLVIGKNFSASDLAYYNNGSSIPSAILSNIYDTVGKVIFPALSSIQDEKERRKELMRQAIRVCVFFLAPIAIGLIVTAQPLVSIVYTNKWLPCVPFLQIYCIRFLPRPLMTITQQSILAIGRSDLILKIEIISNVILMGTLVIAVFVLNSVLMVAWGTIIAVLVGIMLYAVISKRVLMYRYKEQINDLLPAYVSAFIMGIIIYFEKKLIYNQLILLGIQILSGMCIYIIASYFFNRQEMIYLVKYIKSKFVND